MISLPIYYVRVKMLLEFSTERENRGRCVVFGVMVFKHLDAR